MSERAIKQISIKKGNINVRAVVEFYNSNALGSCVMVSGNRF